MPIYNVMEEVVHNVLQQYEKELHLTCNCERCKDDIMAIALNEIQPRYIVNDQLSPVIRAEHVADRQGATNMLSTVAKAARLVSANPRCENAKKE